MPPNDEYERDSTSIPRWLKISVIVVLLLVLLVVVARLVGGGEHGPQRHLGSPLVTGAPQ